MEILNNPDIRKHPIPEHPRHLGIENRMSRSRPQYFVRENEILNNPYLTDHPIHYQAISTPPYHFDREDEMWLNPQFRNKYIKKLRIKRKMTQHKAKKKKKKK